MLLSAVWTLILTAPIHCRGSIGEQVLEYYVHFSQSVPMKKQTHLHLGYAEGEYIFSKFSFLGELFNFTAQINNSFIEEFINKSTIFTLRLVNPLSACLLGFHCKCVSLYCLWSTAARRCCPQALR